MTNEVKNIPELRFPEFSYCWQEKQLGELASVTKLAGFEFTKYVKYSDFGEIPAIRGLNVKNGDFVFSDVKYIDDSDFSKLSRSKLESDNIVYTYVGTIGDAAIVPVNKLWYLAPNVAKIVTKNIEPKFLLQILLDSNFKKKEVLSWISTSSQPALSMTNIRKFKMQIPKSSIEQEKIGDFFSKLDRQIELEEQKLAKLEEQKKGYMQKIFSQELRFKDDNGNSYPDWSIKKIEDISKVNKGFTPNTKNDEYWDELNENWLSIAGMTQKYLYKGNKGITEKGASKHVKVDKDTLIMSFKLTLGKLAIVKEPIYTNEAICHFVWKESNVNTEYMYYYLNSINISTFGAQAVKGVTLNNDSINSIIVKLPVIQEQNKIAYFFNELDKLIRKQYAKIELLKQRKNGLLQKMFV